MESPNEAPAADLSDLSFDQLLELERRATERASGGDEPPGRADDHGGGGEPDDAIVLPWWQHPLNVVTMIVTAAILAGMIGWMVGDANARPTHDEVDTGFLQDMRIHHEQAVLMSLVFGERPDTDAGLRTIATSIVRGQSIDVGRMIQLLRTFGEAEANETDVSMAWMGMSVAVDEMPGMATDAEIDELARSQGEAADRLFVRLMTAHHESGIAMAEFAAEHAANDEVRRMADAMAHSQRDEIVELAHELDDASGH